MTTLQSLLERVQSRRHRHRNELQHSRAAQIVDALLGSTVTTAVIDQVRSAPVVPSPTQYSSHPPAVERIDTSRASSAAPPASVSTSLHSVAVHAQSFVDGGMDADANVIQSTSAAEFPKAKTFGELLELTLSLRPR